MNILLAATSSESFSGASKCLIELAEKISEDPEMNVVVTLPRRGDLERVLADKKIKCYVIKEFQSWYFDEGKENRGYRLKRVLNYLSVFKLMRVIKKERIDIVHENASTAYVPALAAKILHVPYVWHIREFMREDLHISFVDEAYSRRLINSSSKIIAISKPIADRWSEIIDAPIEVINDGVPVDNYLSLKNKALSTIAIYGRIVPAKGQLVFFEAANQLINKYHYNNLKFLWAGKIEDEHYFSIIENYIHDCDISDYCSYLGEVSDVRKFLDRVGTVCVCSTKEGFGRVTVESMLSNCLVIASDSGANIEIIRNNENGLIYGNGSEGLAKILDWALRNENRCRHIISTARQEASEKYSSDMNFKKIKGLYKTIHL